MKEYNKNMLEDYKMHFDYYDEMKKDEVLEFKTIS
jgi:hypothetical protein